MKTNGNDPSNPVQINGDVDVHNYGLSKREYFTAMALQGILRNSYVIEALAKETKDAVRIRNLIATECVKQAEALIDALNAEKEG